MKLFSIALIVTLFQAQFSILAKDGPPKYFHAEIQAVDFDRPPCVVVCDLPLSDSQLKWYPSDGDYVSTSKKILVVPEGKGESESILGQVISSDKVSGSVKIAWTQPGIPAGDSRKLTIRMHTDNRSENDVVAELKGKVIEATSTDQHVQLLKNGKPILQYNKLPTPESKKHEPYYSRSGYIHPLFSPSGAVITGDYALDHKHQHGLFFAWTKTKFEGEPLEFWNQKLQLGKIRHGKNRETKYLGSAFSRIRTHHLWTKTKSPRPQGVLNESWEITAYNLPTAYHVFDIKSLQVNLNDSPLTIEKYHYGGMAIRGADQWLAPEKDTEPPATMLTSDGKVRSNGNHSRPNWVVMSGPIDGKECGVAVMCHPDNFRAPQWVRLASFEALFCISPRWSKSHSTSNCINLMCRNFVT